LRFGSSSGEVTLNWNKWVRQIHRWLSMAFAVAVIGNIVALVQEKQAVWVPDPKGDRVSRCPASSCVQVLRRHGQRAGVRV
jgi:hypothetical protein